MPQLRSYAELLINKLGPITFQHLSHLIARAHGFQRTGSEIKRQTWLAVSKLGKMTKGPNGETIFWAPDQEPQATVPFRGLHVGGIDRHWQDLAYPEKLGLACSTVIECGSSDIDAIKAMSSTIGFGRLRQTTRNELKTLLDEAKKL